MGNRTSALQSCNSSKELDQFCASIDLKTEWKDEYATSENLNVVVFKTKYVNSSVSASTAASFLRLHTSSSIFSVPSNITINQILKLTSSCFEICGENASTSVVHDVCLVITKISQSTKLTISQRKIILLDLFVTLYVFSKKSSHHLITVLGPVCRLLAQKEIQCSDVHCLRDGSTKFSSVVASVLFKLNKEECRSLPFHDNNLLLVYQTISAVKGLQSSDALLEALMTTFSSFDESTDESSKVAAEFAHALRSIMITSNFLCQPSVELANERDSILKALRLMTHENASSTPALPQLMSLLFRCDRRWATIETFPIAVLDLLAVSEEENMINSLCVAVVNFYRAGLYLSGQCVADILNLALYRSSSPATIQRVSSTIYEIIDLHPALSQTTTVPNCIKFFASTVITAIVAEHALPLATSKESASILLNTLTWIVQGDPKGPCVFDVLPFLNTLISSMETWLLKDRDIFALHLQLALGIDKAAMLTDGKLFKILLDSVACVAKKKSIQEVDARILIIAFQFRSMNMYSHVSTRAVLSSLKNWCENSAVPLSHIKDLTTISGEVKGVLVWKMKVWFENIEKKLKTELLQHVPDLQAICQHLVKGNISSADLLKSPILRDLDMVDSNKYKPQLVHLQQLLDVERSSPLLPEIPSQDWQVIENNIRRQIHSEQLRLFVPHHVCLVPVEKMGSKSSYGSVYRATIIDEKTGDRQHVAAKVFKKMEIGIKEAQNYLAVGRHPFITEVIGCTIQRTKTGIDMFVLLLELADGDLSSRLEEAPIQEKDIHRFFYGIRAALLHLHYQGMVHVDLKPQNVLMVRRWDGSETVRIADLGSMMSINKSFVRTPETRVVRTPEYAPPEDDCDSNRNVVVSTGYDVFALGVILMEMLVKPGTAVGESNDFRKQKLGEISDVKRRVRNAMPNEEQVPPTSDESCIRNCDWREDAPLGLVEICRSLTIVNPETRRKKMYELSYNRPGFDPMWSQCLVSDGSEGELEPIRQAWSDKREMLMRPGSQYRMNNSVLSHSGTGTTVSSGTRGDAVSPNSSSSYEHDL